VGEFDYIVDALQATPIFEVLKEMAKSGDYSRLESDAKRHHYVPQFLLRGFSHDFHGKPHVFQMETGTRRAPCRVGLRSAAVREGLYTVFHEDGTPSNLNEGWLALIEDKAAPALKRLVDDPDTLTDAERMTVAFFVATQWMRTPLAAQQIMFVANAAFQIAASEQFSDRNAFGESYRKHFQQEASDEEIEQFRQESLAQVRDGRLRVSVRGGGAFVEGLKHAVEQAPKLFAFDWILLRSPGGLITSDRGIAIYDPSPPKPWASQGFLSSRDVEVTVPVSDSACLLLRPEPPGPALHVQDIDAAGVEALNLRTFGWAGARVFGATQQALVSVREAARRHPTRVVRPKPFCTVIGLEVDPDDDSLARRNERLGYPGRLIDADGVEHDYIVIPIDEPHPELHRLADEAAERRARKRAGLADDEPIEGRLIHEAVHPLDFL
jgi:Protein of unknown function (DUF4238)